MDSPTARNISYVLSFILSVSVICKLNPAVKDFIMNEFIVFSILLFSMYMANKNLLVSFAGAFVATIVISILTLPDPYRSITETFKLIMPDTNSAVKYDSITVQDLINKFGSEEALRKVMSDSDIPPNVLIVDENAPKIASYLETNNKVKF
jgi:hypothetical protein